MRYTRAIEARVVCRDERGRVLLVAGSGGPALPGGSLRHGEDPAAAAARWAAEQAVGELTVRWPLRVVTDVDRRPGWRGICRHRDTIVFAGVAAPGSGGRWLAEEEVAASELTGWVLAALSRLPPDPSGVAVDAPVAAQTRGRQRQRFAAYGHVTDPAGHVLLTRIAVGFPGAGRWHLPGGGTDFGESAPAALRREIAEETGQEGEIGELLRVSHHRAHGSGIRPLDFHGVRVTYAARVARPTVARVVERGGSTDAAAWLSVEAARELPLTDVAAQALARAGGVA